MRDHASTNGSVMLAVDVESDWGTGEVRGIREVLPRLLERLEGRVAGATFFVVADLAGEVRPLIPAKGRFEVGSHGRSHALLTRLDPARCAREVHESRRILIDAGYSVSGFRAPFLEAPASLPRLLAEAGYSYDASSGSVRPSLENRRPVRRDEESGIVRLPPATLRDGVTPFNLTWLRMLHPLGMALVSPRAQMFSLHLHELLDGESGWHRLPFPLRRLHGRNCGRTAWALLDRVLERYGERFVSCRTWLEARAWNGTSS